MRATIVFAATVLAIAAAPIAEAAAKSCSSFAVITGFDAASSSITLKVEKGLNLTRRRGDDATD